MYLHPTGGVDLVAGFGKRLGKKATGKRQGTGRKGKGRKGKGGGKGKKLRP